MTKPSTGDFDATSGGVGDRIGRYRLLRTLGAGGMGRVCLARSEGGRTVAVKLIKPELAAEPEFRERFRLEVAAARRVSDRWTAPVLDADTEAETPWVATGYIAGPSLEHIVSPQGHGPLPAPSVRTLAHGLASALLDIHGAGLVHRDLKPSNVLITIDGPRVIDFGIARALDAVPGSTPTSSGMLVGSPRFMSPEQLRDEPVGPASDVFCMGTVLAYAATGQTPFGGGGSGGVHAVMFRIAQEEPDLTGIEEPVRGLIADCLAKDPADRPTPEEVVARMQPVATNASSPPWLPAQIIAELGRSAVQLLDTDTPPHASAMAAAGTGRLRVVARTGHTRAYVRDVVHRLARDLGGTARLRAVGTVGVGNPGRAEAGQRAHGVDSFAAPSSDGQGSTGRTRAGGSRRGGRRRVRRVGRGSPTAQREFGIRRRLRFR